MEHLLPLGNIIFPEFCKEKEEIVCQRNRLLYFYFRAVKDDVCVLENAVEYYKKIEIHIEECKGTLKSMFFI